MDRGRWWPRYCHAVDCSRAAVLDALSIFFLLACMYRKFALLRPEYAIKRTDRPCLLIKYTLAVAQVFLCIAFFTLSSMEHRTTTASEDIGLTAQGIASAFYASVLLDNGESVIIRFVLILRAFCLCHQFYLVPVDVATNQGICIGIVHCITILLGLFALLPDTSHYNGVGSPYDQSSLVSRLLYLWISPFVSLGKQRRFEIPDIPPLPRVDSTFSASHNFQRALLYERRQLRPSFLRLLRQLYGWEIVGFGLWSAFNKLISLASPFLIREFLQWAQSPEPSRGYVLALAICVQALVSSLSGSQYGLAWSRFDLRLRAGLMAAIYSRTLELSLVEKSEYGMGKLTNYISVDLGRLIGMPGSIFDMILIPTEIALALYLLGHEVSYAFVAGLIVLGVMLPIQTWLGKTLQEVTKAMLQYRDDRVEWSSMTIKGVRVLKLLGWLEPYLDKMRQARTLEMQRLRVRKYLDALCVVFWASTPVIVQSSVFLTVIYSGRDLTAANAFTAIALLDRLIYPMNYFPWIINGFLEARVSALRIRDFLFPEKSRGNPKEIIDGPFIWHECIFSWQKDADSDDLSAPLLPNEVAPSFTMQLYHLELEKSSHVYVVGAVGSGKTSFLLALLGDMPLLNGHRCFPPQAKLSYAPQVPWLFPTSVRRNITLADSDEVVDLELYNRVLAATCLTTDLNKHSKGDLTEVGDGGKNFSGGQCLRIGLARALYQRADLYLLDDCLSGLDKTTASLVMNNLASVLPAHATLVLATHAVNLLPADAKTILVLDKGQIIEVGSYAELSANAQSSFHGMLHYHDNANAPTAIEAQELVDASASQDEETSNEEHREEGVVAAKIWWKYFASMGWHIVFSLFVAVILMQGTRNGLDLWVANYASHHEFSAHTFANGLLILTGCNIVAVAFRSFLFAYGGLRAANTLYAKLIHQLFHATFAFFDRTPLGRLLNRLSGDTYGVDESLPFILNILIKDAADITGTFVILMISNPYVIVLLVPLGVVYFRLQNLYRPTSRHLRRLDSVAQSPLVMHFHATLEGLSVLRGLRQEMNWYRFYLEHLNTAQRMSFLAANASAWFGLRLDGLGVLITSFVGLYAAVACSLGHPVSPGILGLTLIYALPIVGKCNAILGSFIATEQNMISVERVHEYSAVPVESTALAKPPPTSWPMEGHLIVENLSVKYDGIVALTNVSFEIMPREKVGICGRTGAGKSSLLHALFRAVPSTGRIVIDGVDISTTSLETLRSALCFIPQDATLFRGTIRSNLDPYSTYDDASLWEALKQCCLDQVVGGFPQKLNEPIAQGGETLFSRGQAQLLCICRAFLRKSKVVCIDEATASIDHATDHLLQQTLQTVFEDATVLTVAHRMNNIMQSDRIIVLDHGQIVECDSPSVLLKNPAGHFTKLVNPTN